MSLVIRPYRVEDGAALHRIYVPHVTHGTASWEEVPPTVEEYVRRRAEALASGYPCFVAELDGRVIGFSSASSYRSRPGYRFTVEDSVYVDDSAHGRGVGKQLLEALIAECTTRGHRQMIAVIGDSANVASVKLHERCGFTQVAVFENIGWKFGRWLDSVQLIRPLGEGATSPPVTK